MRPREQSATSLSYLVQEEFDFLRQFFILKLFFCSGFKEEKKDKVSYALKPLRLDFHFSVKFRKPNHMSLTPTIKNY